MALIDLKFYSESLGVQTSVYVIIPQKSAKGEIGIDGASNEEKYKCLYLLHGLSDDHTIWLRRTSVERYAAKYGICVVMPYGGRSYYTDMKYGEKYFTYITEELPKRICEFFNVSDKREDNYIAGLSMGGYGALKAALRKPEKYCAVAGMSSVADIRRKGMEEVLKPIFGENIEIPNEEDLFYLAEKTDKNELKPRVYMCVGLGDFLYEDNIRLKEKFESLDYDFTYVESPGTHNWEFWDEYIKYVLAWMLN